MVNDMSYRVTARLQVIQGFIFSLTQLSQFNNLMPRLNKKVNAVHYYQFNIGDYASHTSRLSIWEDCAYRRLLDLYYLKEQPLNGCSTDVARDIGMLDSLGDVEYILNKFFTEKNGEWHNKRCDREIKAYKNKQQSARKAGVASGIARKKKGTDAQRPLNTKATDVEPNIKHKPLTTNHKPKDQTRCFPESLNLDSWNEYTDNRTEKKLKKLTSKGEKKLIDWLTEQGGYETQKQIIDQTIRNGWTGLFELKGAGNGKDTRSRAKRVNDTLDEIARKAIEQSN